MRCDTLQGTFLRSLEDLPQVPPPFEEDDHITRLYKRCYREYDHFPSNPAVDWSAIEGRRKVCRAPFAVPTVLKTLSFFASVGVSKLGHKSDGAKHSLQ